MSAGKILVARENGNYLLKLTGDLRVTLCGSINQCMQAIFGDDDVERVVVDLLSAEGLDSTTLGLLAKLGIECSRKFGLKVEVFCQDESLLRIMQYMGFEDIFDIYREVPNVDVAPQEVSAADTDEQQVRQHVLEAHKLLVELNPDLRNDFVDLIRALETESDSGS